MPLRPVLRYSILIVFSVVSISFCIFFVVQRNATELASHFFQKVSEQTGVVIQAENVSLTLFPKPSISVSNVSVSSSGFDFYVAFVSFRPDFSSLLCGRLEPASLVLIRPKIYGSLAEQDNKSQRWENIDHAYLLDLLCDCRMDIRQGSLDLYLPESLRIKAEGLDLRLKPGFLGGVQGKAGLLNLLVQSEKVRHPGLTHLNANFELHPNGNGWNLIAKIGGAMVKDHALIPFELDCQEISKENGSPLHLRSVALGLGDDNGMLEADIVFPASDGSFSVDGKMKIARLSLTRWLGFARYLAPGLQIALDNLVDGSFSFHFDEKGLEATNIIVNCSGSFFYGRGGVEKWSEPVVFLDLASPQVNLGLGIPESIGKFPARPWFEHRPLTSWADIYDAGKTKLSKHPCNDDNSTVADTDMAGKAGEVGEDPAVFEIGYDIRLSSGKVNYGPLIITDAKTVIAPGKKDKYGNSDVLITAKGDLCDGQLKGECAIGGKDTTTYGISVSLKNLNGKDIAKAFPMLPVASGKFNTNISVTSQGSDLAIFLANLRGKAVLHGEKGQISQPGGNSRIPFSIIDINYGINSAVWKENRLGLKGRWQANLVNRDFSGQASADGSLWFLADSGVGSMDFNQLPGKIRLVLSKQSFGFSSDLDLNGSGLFSFSGGKGVISVSNGIFHCLGLEIEGDLRLEVGKAGSASSSCQGWVEIRANSLASTLGRLGFSISVPEMVSSAKLATDFRYIAGSLAMERIHTRIGRTNLGGSMTVGLKNVQPHLTFLLQADKFDFEDLKKASGNRKQKGKKTALVHETDWDFPIMRLFSANGELKIGEINVSGLAIKDAKIPLELSSGVLTMGRSTANAYRSTLETRGKFDFKKGLASQVVFSINDFDLASVSSGRGSKAKLAGRAGIVANLNSSLSGRAKFVPSLNGTWEFKIVDGSYLGISDSGKPKGKPTKFALVTASGSMSAGVARSKNLLLKGEGLKAGGGGWIDFGKETMDINLDVDMSSVPVFPMRIYGSFDNAQTSIGAGRLILNAIGGVTQGFVNVISGIGEGIWKVFR